MVLVDFHFSHFEYYNTKIRANINIKLFLLEIVEQFYLLGFINFSSNLNTDIKTKI